MGESFPLTGSRSVRVLVVDDDRSILESFKSILRSKGYSVEAVESGREAIERSKAQVFDVALLDIKLEDMEGTKLLTTLHEDLPRMVKIMITGYPELENAIEALNMGADGYVIKPVKAEDLLKVVGEKVKERGEAEEKYEVRRILKSWRK